MKSCFHRTSPGKNTIKTLKNENMICVYYSKTSFADVVSSGFILE